MRNQAIAELYTDKLFTTMCRKYGKDDNEELRSEVVTILLEMPEDKINHIIENKYLLPYALRVVRIQAVSKRDRFNKNFNYPMKSDIDIDSIELVDDSMDITEIEEAHKEAERVIAKIKDDSCNQFSDYFYGSRLVLLKVEKGSIKEVSRSTGIPYRSMQDALKKYVNHLNEWRKK